MIQNLDGRRVVRRSPGPARFKSVGRPFNPVLRYNNYDYDNFVDFWCVQLQFFLLKYGLTAYSYLYSANEQPGDTFQSYQCASYSSAIVGTLHASPYSGITGGIYFNAVLWGNFYTKFPV
jgi:hypothetical protein